MNAESGIRGFSPPGEDAYFVGTKLSGASEVIAEAAKVCDLRRNGVQMADRALIDEGNSDLTSIGSFRVGALVDGQGDVFWGRHQAAEDDFAAPGRGFLSRKFRSLDAFGQVVRKDPGDPDVRGGPGSPRGHSFRNSPQTSSIACICNTAIRLTAGWEDAWARG
ncbi:MAG: hypothetical protein ACLPTZ_18345 [Beijerinckiaceae bacterium]